MAFSYGFGSESGFEHWDTLLGGALLGGDCSAVPYSDFCLRLSNWLIQERFVMASFSNELNITDAISRFEVIGIF